MAQTIRGGVLLTSLAELAMVREALQFWYESRDYVESQDTGDYDLSFYMKLASELDGHLLAYLNTKGFYA